MEARRVVLVGLVAMCGCDRVLGLTELVAEPKNNADTCTCTCAQSAINADRPTETSANDGQQNVGASGVALTGKTLTLGALTNGTETLVALRFPSIGIAHGDLANTPTQIQKAVVQFASTAAFAGNLDVSVELQDSDDAAAFTAGEDLLGEIAASTRPVTSALTWTIPAWKSGEAGTAEQTVDFTSLLQSVITRPGWTANSSLVVFVRGTSTTGGPTAAAFDQAASSAPRLLVTYVEPTTFVNLNVCLPPSLDGNRDGGPSQTPDAGTLDNDCKGRVQKTLSALAVACGYSSVTSTDACTCQYSGLAPSYEPACDKDCVKNTLATDCSNLDPSNTTTANATSGTEPVCTVEGAIAAAMYTRRSECDVTGTASIYDENHNLVADTSVLQTSTRKSILWIAGRPSTAAGNTVGLRHQLSLHDFSVGNWFESTTFSQLAALGGNQAGVSSVAPDPQVCSTQFQFNPNSTNNAARGHRDDNNQTQGLVASNGGALCLGANFSAATCSLTGALSGSINPELSFCEDSGPHADENCTDNASLCGSSASCTGADNGDGTFVCRCISSSTLKTTTLAMNVSGTIVNQPPTSVAGSDQTIECNQTNGATFVLDASGSSDPDGNAAVFRWLKNGRTRNDIVGYQPRITTTALSSVGTTIPYVFRIVDGKGQAHESTTHVTVQDKTAPVIACNTGNGTITPSSVPISFTATASDVCDASPSVGITGYTCFSVSANGTVTRNECVVAIKGGKITIKNSGGVGDHILWTVSATDHANNTATQVCGVLVVMP